MDLHKEMREMVAYLLDTDDSETIESYTETFTAIALEYHNEQLRLLSVVKSVKEKNEMTFEKWIKDHKYVIIKANYINDKGQKRNRKELWQECLDQ